MTKHELLLHAKAHAKAAEAICKRLTTELLAEATTTGTWVEVGEEKIVVVPVEPKLTAEESQRLLDRIKRVLPDAAGLFTGATFNQQAVAAARGGSHAQRQAARLYDEAMAQKREGRAAEGRDRTVQVTVSPERVAEHLAAIEESLAQAAAESVGLGDVAHRDPDDRYASDPVPTAPARRAAPEPAPASFMAGFE